MTRCLFTLAPTASPERRNEFIYCHHCTDLLRFRASITNSQRLNYFLSKINLNISIMSSILKEITFRFIKHNVRIRISNIVNVATISGFIILPEVEGGFTTLHDYILSKSKYYINSHMSSNGLLPPMNLMLHKLRLRA